VVAIVWVAGCRTATRIADVPRVDLDLAGGNRGYLVGSPPAEPELKTTRQMVETTIELPSFYRPTPSSRPVSLGDVAPPERAASEPAAGGAWPVAGPETGAAYKK
jgi:hypothetical protein